MLKWYIIRRNLLKICSWYSTLTIFFLKDINIIWRRCDIDIWYVDIERVAVGMVNHRSSGFNSLYPGDVAINSKGAINFNVEFQIRRNYWFSLHFQSNLPEVNATGIRLWWLDDTKPLPQPNWDPSTWLTQLSIHLTWAQLYDVIRSNGSADSSHDESIRYSRYHFWEKNYWMKLLKYVFVSHRSFPYGQIEFNSATGPNNSFVPNGEELLSKRHVPMTPHRAYATQCHKINCLRFQNIIIDVIWVDFVT